MEPSLLHPFLFVTGLGRATQNTVFPQSLEAFLMESLGGAGRKKVLFNLS